MISLDEIKVKEYYTLENTAFNIEILIRSFLRGGNV